MGILSTTKEFTVGFAEDNCPKRGGVEETTTNTVYVDHGDHTKQCSGCQDVDDVSSILLDECTSPDCSVTESGSEHEEEMTAMLEQMKKYMNEELETQETYEVYIPDLTQYYFSDEEEEESSDDIYTELDAVEYESETSLQNELSRGESESEAKEIARMLERRRAQEERKMMLQMFEHNQFDLDSVKAIWLHDVDRTQKLPGFTMVVTSSEDPLFRQELCIV